VQIWRNEIRNRFDGLELDAVIIEELGQHLDDFYQDAIAGGTTPDEAERLTREELSGSAVFVQERRQTEPPTLGADRRNNMIMDLWQDLRYGLRQLRKHPGFTTVATLTLALGIGANTAIFSLLDAVLLRNLPVKNPEQLIELQTIYSSELTANKSYNSFSYIALKYFREKTRSLSAMIASSNTQFYCAAEGASPERVQGQYVTGDYFSVLGVGARLGRTITMADDRMESPTPAAVISDEYWSRRFGRDPGVIGKRIVIEEIPFTVVGVAPPEFFGTSVGRRVDLWAPLATETLIRRPSATLSAGPKWLQLVGRMKPGFSLEQAKAELETHFRPAVLEPEMALSRKGLPKELSWRLRVEPAGKGLSILRQQFSKPLLILMAVVGGVLLIACANLANLLLARAAARRREIAVRLALGAGRGRLIRQLITETLLLGFLGGGLGLLAASFGTRSLLRIMESGRADVQLNVSPDMRVMGFTALLSILTALLFGFFPALRASRADLTSALKEGGANGESGGSRRALSRGLIVAQIALSLTLVVGAGLFLRSLRNLHAIDLGFKPEQALLATLDPSHSGRAKDEIRALYSSLLEGLHSLPGVQSASRSWINPIAGGGSSLQVTVDGRVPTPEMRNEMFTNWVAPRYFETLGVPLLRGRDFDSRDRPDSPKVAILNQKMARLYFGDEDPIGRRIRVGEQGDVREVIGVVGDANYLEIREQAPPTFYTSVLQGGEGSEFAIRTTGDPSTLIPAVRREIESRAKGIAVVGIRPIMSQIDASIVEERLVALLSACFGCLALFIAAVGLYGVLSYAVARRTREIGVRMALGARATDVMRMILKEILTLSLIGLAIGLPIALAFGRLAADLLYGLSPFDPVTLCVSALVILAAALIAGYLPARRAATVDPMAALRAE
jgi:predicted permease